jgi:hypothetical protein
MIPLPAPPGGVVAVKPRELQDHDPKSAVKTRICRLARQDKVPRSRGAIRPSCAVGRSLQGSRGRRECRERSAPAAACATKSTRVSNHRYAASAGIPCAMVLRLMSRSPRGPGSFAPVIPEKLASQELSASVGAPGPHAFAVRNSIARLATPLRPPHPAPNVRDDREAPLLWVRDGEENTQFLIFRKRNICAWRTDNSNQIESAHEIRFYAHAFWRCLRPSARRERCGIDQTDSPVGQIGS